MHKKTVTLSSGRECEILEEQYEKYMDYLQAVFDLTEETVSESEPQKAKIKQSLLGARLFALEKRYEIERLQRCYAGSVGELTLLEAKELLREIDALSKDGIEEKN